jgi:nucleoside-diphosphate-sugar epimerase
LWFVQETSIMAHAIFITGGTGYIGQPLIHRLLERGHIVSALARPGSEKKIHAGCTIVSGNPLDRTTFSSRIAPADTFIQLVGTPHPSPSKAQQFRDVDLVSVRESVSAAVQAGIRHFIYVSVAHPASMMQAYIEVRREGERLVQEAHLNATILRPWYVLGPGHWWPILLRPAYWMMERIPSKRQTAQRLGLITLGQMVGSLTAAVESPAEGMRIWTVPELRKHSR